MQGWQITPVIFVYLLAAGVTLAATVAVWRVRSRWGANDLALLTLATSVWTIGYTLGLFHTGRAWKLAMLRVEYLGMTMAIFLWLTFVGIFTQRERLSRRANLLLAIVPVLTLLQVLFVDRHHLFYRSYSLTVENGLVVSSKVYGPGFLLWAIWSYAAIAAGYGILVHRILTLPARRRRLIPFLLVGVLVTTVGNLSYLSGNNPLAPYDPTPLCGTAGVLFLILVTSVHRFLDVMPVAHHTVFDNLNAGVLIANEEHRLIEANPLALEWLGAGDEVVGHSIVDLLPQWTPPPLVASGEVQEVEHQTGDRTHVWEMQTTPILGRRQQLRGFVIVLYDIHRRKKLEHDQERLIDELQDALSQIKTLRGLLPICSNCKRIRDEEGTWNPFEAYIRERSQANFSHGICPECVHRLKQDLALDEEKASP